MRFTSQMDLALNEAQKAALAGETPVGAVIVDAGGQVLGAAGNRTRRTAPLSSSAITVNGISATPKKPQWHSCSVCALGTCANVKFESAAANAERAMKAADLATVGRGIAQSFVEQKFG